jgi:hypothetical protein
MKLFNAKFDKKWRIMSDEQQKQVSLSLRDLAYCWENWSLRDFVEEFYIPCFKSREFEKEYYENTKDENGVHVVKFMELYEKDDYLREKYNKFNENPVRYIGSMDNNTIQYFAVAIHNSYTDQLEKS